MPPFNFLKRNGLMELRAGRFVRVEEFGIRKNYDREETREWLLSNYDRLFGPLRRPKSREVPADVWRKSWMVSILVDTRRAEIAANVLPGGLHKK
jgi:hypothetical protein